MGFPKCSQTGRKTPKNYFWTGLRQGKNLAHVAPHPPGVLTLQWGLSQSRGTSRSPCFICSEDALGTPLLTRCCLQARIASSIPPPPHPQAMDSPHICVTPPPGGGLSAIMKGAHGVREGWGHRGGSSRLPVAHDTRLLSPARPSPPPPICLLPQAARGPGRRRQPGPRAEGGDVHRGHTLRREEAHRLVKRQSVGWWGPGHDQLSPHARTDCPEGKMGHENGGKGTLAKNGHPHTSSKDQTAKPISCLICVENLRTPLKGHRYLRVETFEKTMPEYLTLSCAAMGIEIKHCTKTPPKKHKTKQNTRATLRVK